MNGFATAAFRAALLGTAAFAISACAYGPPRDRDEGYRANAYYSEDPCDHDSSYCGYPTYDGGIYVEGNWYDGHYRYRDTDHGREYWFNKGWRHADQTRDRDAHNGDGDHHDSDHHDQDHSGDSH